MYPEGRVMVTFIVMSKLPGLPWTIERQFIVPSGGDSYDNEKNTEVQAIEYGKRLARENRDEQVKVERSVIVVQEVWSSP